MNLSQSDERLIIVVRDICEELSTSRIFPETVYDAARQRISCTINEVVKAMVYHSTGSIPLLLIRYNLTCPLCQHPVPGSIVHPQPMLDNSFWCDNCQEYAELEERNFTANFYANQAYKALLKKKLQLA